jgi:hypothetical protein
MKEKGLVVFNVLVGLAVTVGFLFSYSRPLQAAAFDWVLLCLVVVAVPAVWSYRMARALEALDVPLPRELRRAPYYPVLAAVITLLAVSTIVRGAVLFR